MIILLVNKLLMKKENSYKDFGIKSLVNEIREENKINI
jgi:hypothetical protein